MYLWYVINESYSSQQSLNAVNSTGLFDSAENLW